MNGAVSEAQFKGFSLRLRTASSGSYVLPPLFSNSYSVAQGEVNFFLSAAHANALTEGQYYKLQIAYCGSSTATGTGSDIGYYSTVGVAKCISKPEVTIRNLVYENINAFNNEYFGFYDLTNCKDRTEKVYSYEFKIYDEQDNIFYSSGEKLHQSSYDTEYTSSIDRIVVNDFASTDIIYSIEYTVTTLNGFVISSPKYKISSQYLVAPNGNIKVVPEADEENGIIIVHFLGETDPNHSYYYTINEDVLNNLEVDEEGKPLKDSGGNTMISKTAEVLGYQKDNEKLAYLRANSLYKHVDPLAGNWFFTFLRNVPGGLTAINGRYYHDSDIEYMRDIPLDYLAQLDYYEKILPGKDILQSLTYGYVSSNFIDLSKKMIIDTSEHERKYFGSYLLSRASDEDNYTTWFNIARFRLDDQIPSSYTIKDVTIEHGRKYKYAIQQYNIWGLYSARIVSDVFEASFEDAFLFDGEKSLRIRYNPTVDTFKTTILEQKTDTIGGRYPFITRNGATYYKEFPIGGLLAQEIDQWHQFVNPYWDHGHRHSTGADLAYNREKDKWIVKDAAENLLWDSHDFSDTTIALERNFKLKVLEWLNNGKPKLFKSPYEGNYIVRLMNNTLVPVKELGRMLHSFTSQAYEIAECTYDNLVAYGFIKTSIPSDLIGLWSSYDLHEEQRDVNGDVILKFENGIQSFTIQDLMPGDIIYLKFIDQDEELPIMIGITGSYTYEGISSNLVQVRIPQPEDHELTGVVNVFYTGMRVTDFDSIINMQLKTVISQQYVGTSPWMQRLKRTPWDPVDPQTRNMINDDQYKELQNYNFRTYLDQTVSPLGKGNYAPSQNFVKLVRSFDPGELLDRINLTINQGDKYKTELLNMEMMRFRERPLIPVFVNDKQNWSGQALYVPGEYSTLLTQRKKNSEAVLLCATTPYGYPHPIEELAEYELLDPFCIYQVFVYNANLEDWVPIISPMGNSYYDPYYRTWLSEDYDPTVKLNFTWTPVAYLENEIIGYCTESQLDNFKDNYSSLYGEYWIDENTKFSFDNYALESLSSVINTEEGYTIPVYSYTEESWALINANKEHQENKTKLEHGEYINKALNEKEMYDAVLELSYYDAQKQRAYYEYKTKKGKEFIQETEYELFEKVNDLYFAIGVKTIQPNTVYWVKTYDVKLNMTTEKVIEYKDIDLMNSYHIGNGVVAELTFQIRIIDYYTEVYDEDVRRAKEAYLNAKAFYTELMKTYNIIAKANLNRDINHGFKELYYRMLNGNKLGESVDERDQNSIQTTLKHENSKNELKLMSLYNITILNQANNNDIIKLLIDYKDTYAEEDRPEAFDAVVIYHYFEETVTKIIDEYYILDSREYLNEDNTYCMIDISKGDIPADKEVTYKYTSGTTGNTYYYKVNKDAYVNEYRSSINSLANAEDLRVKYDIEHNQFVIITLADLATSTDKLYELTIIEEPATLTYLDLLNEDELKALKETTMYVYSNLAKEYDENNQYVELKNRELYEEAEIITILESKRLDGALNKLASISKEIEEMNTNINEKQTFINNLKVNYIDAYNKVFDLNTGELKKYNQSVYDDWAGRVLAELFSTFATNYSGSSGTNNLSFIREWFSIPADADDIPLKQALIQVLQNGAQEADVEILAAGDMVKAWLFAAEQLYQSIGGKLPEVQRYNQMIIDNSGDDDLDKILAKRIELQRGRIVLEFYALYTALSKVIETMNDNVMEDDEIVTYIGDLEDRITKYEYLYGELIDSNKKFKEEEYRDIKSFLDSLVDNYFELYTIESSKLTSSSGNNALGEKSYNLYNLCLLSCYYEDYDFLQKAATQNVFSGNQIHLSFRNHEINLKTIAKNSFQNGITGDTSILVQPIATWADPFNLEDQSNLNIFASIIANLSNTEIAQVPNYKDTAIYFYRLTALSGEDAYKTVNGNPIPYFIFNPLSENRKDPILGNRYQSNSAAFNALDSATKKNNVLKLHQEVISSILRILNGLSGNNSNLETGWVHQIENTYVKQSRYPVRTENYPNSDLFTERWKLIQPSTEANGEIKWSALATLQKRIEEALAYLSNKYTDTELEEIFGMPISNIKFEIGIDDKMPDEYYIKYINSSNLVYNETNNYFPKEVNIATNWYQAIMIPEETLELITKLVNENSDIDDEGIYYEYIEIYLKEIEELSKIVGQAEILQRLYQKQVDVYTLKYDKYSEEYEINQDIYSSYGRSEAFEYYNLLNKEIRREDYTTDAAYEEALAQLEEKKNNSIQTYKKMAQEAWWAFLNLLDARYSAEKERGMYV